MSIKEFWDITPYQLKIYISAKASYLEAEYKKAIAYQWHGAFFTRVKKLDKLDAYLKDDKGRETWQDIKNKMIIFNENLKAKEALKNGK